MQTVQALVPFLMIFLFLFVLVILPARRQRRQVKEMLQQVKVGDEVMMQSGQYGRIVALDATTVEVEIAPGVITRWTKQGIAALAVPPAADLAHQESETKTEISTPVMQDNQTAHTVATTPDEGTSQSGSKVSA